MCVCVFIITLLRWYLASGDIISGCSVMKVGLMMLSSRKWPTNLSTRRATVRGFAHSIYAGIWEGGRVAHRESELEGMGLDGTGPMHF